MRILLALSGAALISFQIWVWQVAAEAEVKKVEYVWWHVALSLALFFLPITIGIALIITSFKI